MNEIDKKYLVKLSSEVISLSSLPKSVKNASYFQQLLRGGILKKERSGNGWKVMVNNKDLFKKFIQNHFPVDELDKSKSSNTKNFRNSKSKSLDGNRIIFIRGWKKCLINNQMVDLEYHNSKFGLFATQLNQITTNKICFVENLEPFLRVEEILDKDYIFIHVYGRIGKSILNKISTNDILVFSDFDFVGLREYLLIKRFFKKASFFLPNNYDQLFDEYSRKLSTKNERQILSKEVEKSKDEVVVKIREQVLKTQHFLEQEAIF